MSLLNRIVVRKPIFGEGENLGFGVEVVVGREVDRDEICDELENVGLWYSIINSSIVHVDPCGLGASPVEVLEVIRPILDRFGSVDVRNLG